MAKDVRFDIIATDKTARAFKSMSARMTMLRGSINRTVASAARIGAAFAGASVIATSALVKMRMAAIDSLAKTADKLGVTTEALAGFRHAAELSGVPMATLDKSLQNMAVQIENAAKGMGLGKRALEDLNINALALSKLPLDQQMLAIADAMKNVESQTEKVRIAYELFGARGVGVLNMMKGGAEGMKAMAKEAETLGIAISRVDAAQIEAANDSVTRATSVFEGFGNQLSVALSPMIAELATNFYQVALDAQTAGDVGQRVARALAKGFGFVADAVLGLKLLIKGIQAAFALLMNILLSGLAQLFSKMDSLIERYNKIAEFFGMDTIQNKAKDAAQGLADAFLEQFNEITGEIKQTLSEPLPSERIMEFYDDVQAKARETAEVIAATAPGKIAADAAGAEQVTKLSLAQKARMEGAEQLKEFEEKTAEEKTQFVMQQMGEELAGVSKHSKKLFALQKAMQIGQALMNTYMAATKALAAYPPPLNVAFAALAVANGMAQVSQIRAQSFEGGGFTGRGARAGGLDGKGGYMAMVHPNETIVDHTRTNGSNVQVVVNSPPGTVTRQRQERENGKLRIVLDQMIEDKINKDIVSGRGVASVFESRYGLRR